MEDKQITRRNLIMFPLGTVGRDMVYNLVTSYLLSFVLFTHKLTAAQLTAITAIMVAARIFDALNDPSGLGFCVVLRHYLFYVQHHLHHA